MDAIGTTVPTVELYEKQTERNVRKKRSSEVDIRFKLLECMENRLNDPRRIVEQGYDKIATQYLEWTSSRETPRTKYLNKLLGMLPPGARALEAGCGAGVPCTQILAQQTEATAVDVSAEQIALAKVNAPCANILRADITSLHYEAGTFDAIVSFYTIFHVPRAEQEHLLTRFALWLREGGVLVMNLGVRSFSESIEEDWLGARMYWSSFDAETNLELVRRAGFQILESEIIEDEEEENKTVPFLWILASKPSPLNEGSRV